MQSLYETHKLLTYPRTDSRYITKDVAATLPERLRAIAIGPYKDAASAVLRSKPLQTKYIVNDAKVTDHHAIIPTEQYVDLNKLSREERHIYDLVVRRFIAVLSAPFEYDEVQVKITVGRYNFYTKGQSVKSAGWKALYDSSLADDDDDAEPDLAAQRLPALSQGAAAAVKEVRVCAGKTSPPARYTEATLLTAMENPASQVEDGRLRDALKTAGGLGTPATRADIIEKLFNSFYIERRGREIFPTSKGRQLIGIVPPDLKSAELTAKWEQQLSLIAEGKANDRKFIEEMRGYASSLVQAVKSSTAEYKHDNITREPCPQCGKYLLEVNGKKGKMLVCQDRDCGYRKSISVITNARCPECHKKLEMRGEGDKKHSSASAATVRSSRTSRSARKAQARANGMWRNICSSRRSRSPRATPLPTSLQNGWRKTNEAFSFCIDNSRDALNTCLLLREGRGQIRIIPPERLALDPRPAVRRRGGSAGGHQQYF